jgi:hypothetical protein
LGNRGSLSSEVEVQAGLTVSYSSPVASFNGKSEHHKEGNYWLRRRESEKQVRISVGTNAADAFARQLKQEQVLRTRALGVPGDDPAYREWAGAAHPSRSGWKKCQACARV